MNSTIEYVSPIRRKKKEKQQKMKLCKIFVPQKVAEKEGILGEKPSKQWCKQHEKSIPKSFTKIYVKKYEKVKTGSDGVHAAPPQEHSNFEDPTEVIYLKKKVHQ